MINPMPFPATELDDAGLNRQHVFNLSDLPAEVLAPLGPLANFTQLILLGHAGRRLWTCVQAAHLPGEHPIDDYTTQVVSRLFTPLLGNAPSQLVYPGEVMIGLQALGHLAGWHHPAPFMVGIDSQWGSWSAYRAVILAQSQFPISPRSHLAPPCPSCLNPPCISACPAQALQGGEFVFSRCSTFRLLENSPCAQGCLARLACPVGQEHRYDEAQIVHSYQRSLQWLRQMQRDGISSAR